MQERARDNGATVTMVNASLALSLGGHFAAEDTGCTWPQPDLCLSVNWRYKLLAAMRLAGNLIFCTATALT